MVRKGPRPTVSANAPPGLAVFWLDLHPSYQDLAADASRRSFGRRRGSADCPGGPAAVARSAGYEGQPGRAVVATGACARGAAGTTSRKSTLPKWVYGAMIAAASAARLFDSVPWTSRLRPC